MSATSTVITMCPMNCHPTLCGMRVTVADGRVTAVDGDPANPDSRGFLCVRGRAAVEIRDNPQRLLTPLRRVGPRGANQWEPISWKAALNEIVAQIAAAPRNRSGLWFGHGSGANGATRPLLMRFGHLSGMQVWNPAMVCWALGGYGLGLTGVLECNTKEDMAEHSRTILLWGANLASQPTTAPHLVAARRRGARVILIDVRRSEAARHADEVVLIRPGSDAALALAMAQVIITEGLHDQAFIAAYTLGFAELAQHLAKHTPEWAASITGLEPDVIRRLARTYAGAGPSMIILGGSSIFKHRQGWEPARAIACLPALTGQLGRPGTGFGPRHRGFTRGAALAFPDALEQRPPGDYIPNHMPSIAAALEQGRIETLILFGTNMLSSFADAGAVERGLARTKLVVAVDIFMNETIRRAVDIVLPGTVWIEELGLKDTATHIYLMERGLEPAGQARSINNILRDLAECLTVRDFFPWADDQAYVDALLAAQTGPTGEPLTVSDLRAADGRHERSALSHVAYPDQRFHTPSGKIEFVSARAASVGLPALPTYTPSAFSSDELADPAYPLRLAQGRTLSHFHSFYDNGQALPSLARLNTAPELWVNPLDAAERGITAGADAAIVNACGRLEVGVRITTDVPPGVLWLRDGWFGLNHLTSGVEAMAAEAVDLVDARRIPGGQSAYDVRVELIRFT